MELGDHIDTSDWGRDTDKFTVGGVTYDVEFNWCPGEGEGDSIVIFAIPAAASM